MFVDYYALFEISETSTAQEIKFAFKKQALRWHPDRNPGIDTTEKMQLLNEARLILLDEQAKDKYDHQYRKFKKFEETKKQRTQQQSRTQQHSTHEETRQQEPKQKPHKHFEHAYTHTDFEVDDELLKRWTNNAKKQAVNLAKQTIEELKGMTKAA
jgi:curved DNA-binding protein CbpA